MQLKIYIFSILFILLGLNPIKAQQKNTIADSSYKESYSYISNFFKKNELSKEDSIFFKNIRSLNNFTNNDSLKIYYSIINKVIQTNSASLNIQYLKSYIKELEERKIEYDSLMNIWLHLQNIKQEIDTGHVSSTDSNFIDYIDILFNDADDNDSTLQIPEPTSNNDSIISDEDIFISNYDKYYRNDTLIRYMNTILNYYQTNEIIEWIDEVRRDTFNFYIIGTNNDSIEIKLYSNNPNILRFPITDIWGKEIPAIARNIQPNSLVLMVDKSPIIPNKTKKRIFKDPIKSPATLYHVFIPMPDYLNKWRFYGNSNVDLSQVGMHQWAQGGEPSISFLLGTELFLDYKDKRHTFTNHAIFRYGMIRQGRYADKSTNKLNANVDRLELNSKYGLQTFGYYNVTTEGDLKTQFMPQTDKETNEVLSQFMSPGYTTFSLGLDYKKYKNFALYVSPAALKTTFVLDSSNNIKRRYNVDTTKNFRSEFGFRLQTSLKLTVWEKIDIYNKIELYSNYLHNPENVDINWEMQLDLPINEWIRASIGTHLIYDDDQNVPKYNLEKELNTNGETEEKWVKTEGPGLQFMESLKLGIKVLF